MSPMLVLGGIAVSYERGTPVLRRGRTRPGCGSRRPGILRVLRVYLLPPLWRQPRGKSMVSLANCHTNAVRIGWHLGEIDLRVAPGLPPGWSQGAGAGTCRAFPPPGKGADRTATPTGSRAKRHRDAGRVGPGSRFYLLPSQGAGAGTGRAVPPAPPRTSPPAKVDRITFSRHNDFESPTHRLRPPPKLTE